jgi:hypothetical protein
MAWEYSTGTLQFDTGDSPSRLTSKESSPTPTAEFFLDKRYGVTRYGTVGPGHIRGA